MDLNTRVQKYYDWFIWRPCTHLEVSDAEVGHVRKFSGIVTVLFHSELKDYKVTLCFFHVLVTLTSLFSDVLHTVNMESVQKLEGRGYICNSRSSKYTRS